MKKTITARAATKKNLQGKLTIGLDLGDHSSGYCVLDKAGEVIGEQKVSTTQKAITEVFAAMPCSRVALSASSGIPWRRSKELKMLKATGMLARNLPHGS